MTMRVLLASRLKSGLGNNHPQSVHRRNARPVENNADVGESVQENPRQSISRCSQEMGFRRSQLYKFWVQTWVCTSTEFSTSPRTGGKQPLSTACAMEQLATDPNFHRKSTCVIIPIHMKSKRLQCIPKKSLHDVDFGMTVSAVHTCMLTRPIQIFF